MFGLMPLVLVCALIMMTLPVKHNMVLPVIGPQILVNVLLLVIDRPMLSVSKQIIHRISLGMKRVVRVSVVPKQMLIVLLKVVLLLSGTRAHVIV